ncbi:hypothetical protein M3G04_09815 [Dietzia cinnamea]|uniref:hypothetical protein n=1 Tax=Dietzia cinnamea TaxID=321318 RepID=UPI00223BC2E2|nr:hypothetical protein [Dietzia cinnamea]MCT2301182.1 hypothetical protein [Dietzia cinnamea]
MIDILTAPAAGAAAQELTSTPHLATLVDDALAAYGDWDAATAALDACTGTAYEVETARLAKRAAYHRYNRRVDALAEATGTPFPGDWITADAGIRYLHDSNAAWEHALDNPDAFSGF